ncbi:MAG: anti-sigma factor family protein [Candidatus Aminicenantia bacterium]
MNKAKLDKEGVKKGFEILSSFISEENLENCPDEEMLAAFMDGELNEQEERDIRNHIRECSFCSYLIISLESQGIKFKKKRKNILDRLKAAILSKPYILRPAPVLPILLLIFILGFIFVLKFPQISRRQIHYREIGKNRIELIEPIGEIKAVPSIFKWRQVEGVKYYIFELLDEELSLVWESDQLFNNKVSLPQDVINSLINEKTYFWRVTAFLKNGQKIESHTQDFELKK